jgi:hypothetical protein
MQEAPTMGWCRKFVTGPEFFTASATISLTAEISRL